MPASSTQQYIPIRQIHDGVVVLNDGSIKSVLLVSSVNFALKGEDEQRAMIESYVTFLNTLDFPIQILVQSRALNLGHYLGDLGNRSKAIANDLLRQQMVDYVAFVKELLSLGDIMTKKFFVIVPYSNALESKPGFFARLTNLFMPAGQIKLSRKQFTDLREQLDKRLQRVFAAVQQMGLSAIQLDTQGLMELYYSSYNPYLTKIQPVTTANLQKAADL